MPLIALDIETAADPQLVAVALAAEPRFTAPSNYKDPEKIAAYVEAAAAQWRAGVVSEAGLTPRTGRVVCVGYQDLDAQEAPRVLRLGGPVESGVGFDTEQGLLAAAGTALAVPDTIVVTFNGAAFDVPFLRWRMVRHGVPVPDCLKPAQGRYMGPRHYDLRLILSDGDRRAHGTLESWAVALGVSDLPHKGGMDGSDVQAYVDAGRWAELASYCARDVVATAGVWAKIAALV